MKSMSSRQGSAVVAGGGCRIRLAALGPRERASSSSSSRSRGRRFCGEGGLGRPGASYTLGLASPCNASWRSSFTFRQDVRVSSPNAPAIISVHSSTADGGKTQGGADRFVISDSSAHQRGQLRQVLPGVGDKPREIRQPRRVHHRGQCQGCWGPSPCRVESFLPRSLRLHGPWRGRWHDRGSRRQAQPHTPHHPERQSHLGVAA